MKTLWNLVSRILFWDYERGSFPYDLMVLGVVAFVFLTPRAWFNDRPVVSSSGLRGEQLHLLSEDPATGAKTFRIDAKLLAPAIVEPQLESKAHALLQTHVEELRQKKFSIKQAEPKLAPDGTVLYYDVVVR